MLEEDKKIEQLRQKLYDYEMELPENDWEALSSRIDAPAKGRVIPLTFRRWAAAASVVLLLGSAGLLWLQRSSRSSEVEAPEQAQMAHTLQHSQSKEVVTPISKPYSDSNLQVEHSYVAQSNHCALPTATPSSIIADDNNTLNQIEQTSMVEESSDEGAFQPLVQDNLNVVESEISEPSLLSIEEATKLLEAQHNSLEASTLPHESGTVDESTGWSLGALASLNPSAFSSLSTDSRPIFSSGFLLQQNKIESKRQAQHDIPITVGLQVGVNLIDKLDLNTGVSYTYMFSKFNLYTVGGLNKRIDKQSLHYIGIPLQLSYRFFNWRVIGLYASAGGAVEKGLTQKVQSEIVTDDNVLLSQSRTYSTITGFQWSINGNIGLSVKLVEGLKLYVEPGLAWYIPNQKSPQPESQHTESPFNFNLQIGIRYDFLRK